MQRLPLKPLIGITALSESHAEPYIQAIERNGGSSRVIIPDHNILSETAFSGIGGIMACGAGDQERVPCETETHLLKEALQNDMPLLCISTGMHALNTAMGGTLVQPIDGHDTVEHNGEVTSSYHHIYISPGSKLAAIVGSGGFVRVNSRHQKALREAHKSPLLLASAYSLTDGVIEALESPSHRWVIGVQFQPERRMEIPPHFDRLFQSLLERAEEYINAET